MRKGGRQKSRRDDTLITRGKRGTSATPGLNANGITPATVVRQKKQCSCMAGNDEMLKKTIEFVNETHSTLSLKETLVLLFIDYSSSKASFPSFTSFSINSPKSVLAQANHEREKLDGSSL